MTTKKYHYECIGCKKGYNTYKEYPDGWICLKCRDTVKISLKCSECGSDVKVYWNTYRMKDPNTPWRCRSCNDKYRNSLYDAKSDEEKKAFVETQRNRSKEYWANLSDEEKINDSERRKKLWDERRATGKDKYILDALVRGRARWWNNLSDEEKKAQWDYMNVGRDKWWSGLSEEEKEKHMKNPHRGFTDWYNSLSDEEKKAFMTPVWNGNRDFWDNIDRDTYEEWNKKRLDGMKVHFDSLRNNPNKNESEFINNLNMNNIIYDYQYHSKTKHQDFDVLFPINSVNGSTMVSPYHAWDFIIHTRGGDVLVDVDGSIHDPKNSTTGITVFNDSKRPYQTDGLPAYAVLCYDDNLTDNTPVLNIKTNEKMPFKSLMSILKWMDMDDNEKRELIQVSEIV